MSHSRSPAPQLVWRARLRLAGLSLLVMGTLLYGAGLLMGRLLLQTQEAAIQRELQTLAGTLHDSLKPALPRVARPTASLVAVLPGLCVVGEPCSPPEDLIHRHAVSATDPDRYKLRVLDHHGGLVASSPGPLPVASNPGLVGWELTGERAGERWGTYAIHLHHSNGPGEPIWGYLQISYSLAAIDAEAKRLWWLGHGVFALAMVGMALASWWLAGLAMAPLIDAYRRQEQFSADVAHELRTPLANLLAVAEAERGAAAASSPHVTASLNRVLAQGQRLQRLIADLLLLASLEQSTPQEVPEFVRIAECLDDLIEEFSETARSKDVILALQIADSQAVVRGRETELIRLLANVLSNAIKHSPPAGVVSIAVEQQGSELRLSVVDQGPGMTKHERERIFERFYRTDASRSRHSGGTGLGLAIAWAIARRHRWRLTVHSTPGAGSTFVLQLPVVT